MAFNGSLELCEKGTENYFMMLKLVDLLNAATKICPISCITTEYVGKLQLMKDSYPGMTLYWHFESTDVQGRPNHLLL